MHKFNMFIDGNAVPAAKYSNLINPATGDIVGQCPSATLAQLDQVVAAAQRAFPAWSRTSNAARAQAFQDLADMLEGNSQELMTLLTQEMGRPWGGRASAQASKSVVRQPGPGLLPS